MHFVRRTTIVLAIAGTVAGCVTGAASSLGATNRVSAGRVVTAQELKGIPQQGTVMDALKRLRPEWLVSRAGTPYVMVDGAPATDLSLLDTILASTIRELRIERASSNVGHAAIAPNGRVIVGDIIIVTSRHGGDGSHN
jgi:hypothetical protein